MFRSTSTATPRLKEIHIDHDPVIRFLADQDSLQPAPRSFADTNALPNPDVGPGPNRATGRQKHFDSVDLIGGHRTDFTTEAHDG
jgi:hypothetical protein